MTDAPLVTPARRKPAQRGILVPTPHPLSTIAIAVGAVVLITIVGFVLGDVDLGLARALNALHVGALGAFTTAVYHVISPVPAIGITIVVTGVVWLVRRDVRPAAAFAGTVAITWVPSDLVKEFVQRPRPDTSALPHPFATQPDPSYPSGHTVFVVAFVIALAWVLRDTRWHRLAVVLGSVVVIVVVLALTIDAVHFPTDTVASVLWALAVAPAARLVWVDLAMPRLPVLRRAEYGLSRPRA
ncbi:MULTISPECIES: phosphatase PAP2 family protein [unclassified Curtobacterium]|uniref:phosphatase PAP2 family protein n=1 Tax=unclassified Curtobacterium TaxID=257496 RepID=UPI000D985BB2|nr:MULTISPECIES: phosphatase PAP2 family protein [unclassified Curtobacterium]PYY35676.1 phosphoesterase [Curtobacterium sp. MCPF17_046]WIB15738.1 phosphatase PAP2 family protein [Curtobacterium sp. MCPF17_050]